MKKDNTGTWILIGLGVFLLLQQRQVTTYPPGQYPYQNFPNIPQAPSTKGQAFQQWAQSIVNLYGNIKALWEPGGPFYKHRTDDIFDVIDVDPNSAWV